MSVYTLLFKSLGLVIFLKDASHALHLFDQNSNIVKHYSNLKYLFSILFHFILNCNLFLRWQGLIFRLLIPSVSHDPSEIIQKC